MKGKLVLLAAAILGVLSTPASAEDAFFDANGVKIRYVSAGEGETVVLIHGWLSDSTMWGRDASGNTKLNTTGVEGFRFVALDCRGHGKSDKPHDREKYGAEMAADVVRLLDHLKVKKAHLVGYSMGAFIAGKVAATHPDRVLSVFYGGQAPLLPRSEAPSGPSETEIFAKAVEEDKGLGPYLLAVMPPDRPKLTLDQANGLTKLMFAGKDVKALAAAGLSFDGLRVSAKDLRRCKAPALFLYGANESESTKAAVAEARKVLAGSELIVVEGADHVTTLGKREFGTSLIAFLKANREKRF